MAQAIVKKQVEEKSASIDSPVLFQLQAPEGLKPQVLVKIAPKNQAELQSPKKKLLKVFAKIKYNARISEEFICINNYKGNLDAKLLGARNSMIIF